jgi:hypothetical protein
VLLRRKFLEHHLEVNKNFWRCGTQRREEEKRGEKRRGEEK